MALAFPSLHRVGYGVIVAKMAYSL